MTDISTQIYLSRDQTRDQIIEFMKSYLELENVDLTKSSFLSFLIDTIATLTSNLLFYQTSVYREFFLTRAQLQESVLNLAAFLGYRPAAASYASANLLVTIPFGFSDPTVTFSIDEGFEFKADNVLFQPYYDTEIVVTNNASVSITVNEDGRIYPLPVEVDTTSDMQFTFLMPVRQYKTTQQEFQIDSDLQIYQFTNINVPFDGKISTIEVRVKEPGSDPSDSGLLYDQFDSLYLMSSSDHGYVYRRTDDGVSVFFGNGLIGVQPTPGSTVIVNILETEGADGNVIAGSITQGERIYTQQGSPPVTQTVNYSVINPSPASGGADEEDLEATRQNAIASLTALNRLVTQSDFENADTIITGSPLAQNSVPVLKRSDLVVNEIQLFTSLEFSNSLVPMRNALYELLGSSYIPRDTVISINGVDYYTLFDMTTEIMNSVAYYHYIMSAIDIVPVLVQSFASNPYSLYVNNLEVVKSGNTARYRLSYYSTESDYNLCSCQMSIVENETAYTMTNVPGANGGYFEYTFNPYTDVPDGNNTYYFRISNPTGLISEYSTSLVFRQNLDEFMLSNAVMDGTSTIVYDIPVVKKDYYDGIDQRDFELQVMQATLQSMDFVNYRMLTDFVNVKFCNTTGTMENMLLNTPTKQAVIDIGDCTVPIGSVGDRYIVSGHEGGVWDGHKDDIALCIDSTAQSWTFNTPNTNDILTVTAKGSKYIYTQKGWVVPTYEIPLTIEVEVMRDTESDATEARIVEDVKSELYSTFSDRFGPQASIFRSEIIDVVQSVDGVSHCRLIQPTSNIFFNFQLEEFSQEQLLEYGPEYVYFTTDNIVVRVLSSVDE